jgi:hypothetical protein
VVLLREKVVQHRMNKEMCTVYLVFCPTLIYICVCVCVGGGGNIAGLFHNIFFPIYLILPATLLPSGLLTV